jgi:hypothetical protein
LGGDGDDTLTGSSGADSLVGGAGNDQIGGEGDDEMHGGFASGEADPGNDILRGGTGKDTMFAGGGDDTLDGESGNDSLEAGGGSDLLRGGTGNDMLSGPKTDEARLQYSTQYSGGAGNDTMLGTTGPERFMGGSGNDTIRPQPGIRVIDGAIVIGGGSGNDKIQYGGVSGNGLTVNAGSGNDTVTTGGGADVQRGEAGNDTLRGGGGDDYLYGGLGLDRLFGQAGGDRLRGDQGSDRGDGGAGRDACEAEREVRCEIEEIILRPEQLLRALETHRVAYVVIGGVAAVAHGARLATSDLDVTPAADPRNLARIGGALRDLGARIRVPELPGVPRVPGGLAFPFDEVTELPTWYSWNLLTSAGRLDLVFRPAGVAGFGELRDGARAAPIGTVVAPTASLTDLIRIKEAAGRPKDLRALPTLYQALGQAT